VDVGGAEPDGGIRQEYTWSSMAARFENTCEYVVNGKAASCPPGAWHERQRDDMTGWTSVL
jgi:hypothetical protein